MHGYKRFHKSDTSRHHRRSTNISALISLRGPSGEEAQTDTIHRRPDRSLCSIARLEIIALVLAEDDGPTPTLITQNPLPHPPRTDQQRTSLTTHNQRVHQHQRPRIGLLHKQWEMIERLIHFWPKKMRGHPFAFWTASEQPCHLAKTAYFWSHCNIYYFF
jgi:hypothetical protein